MGFKLPKLFQTEILLASIFWWVNYVYILIVAAAELNAQVIRPKSRPRENFSL